MILSVAVAATVKRKMSNKRRQYNNEKSAFPVSTRFRSSVRIQIRSANKMNHVDDDEIIEEVIHQIKSIQFHSKH